MATSSMPGTEFTIWLASPRPMNPAPTMPTRIGLPAVGPALQGPVDDDHRPSSASTSMASGAQSPSFVDSEVTGIGHVMPTAGSS